MLVKTKYITSPIRNIAKSNALTPTVRAPKKQFLIQHNPLESSSS